MDGNELIHGHVDHSKKFRFYSKSKESKSLNVLRQRITYSDLYLKNILAGM